MFGCLKFKSEFGSESTLSHVCTQVKVLTDPVAECNLVPSCLAKEYNFEVARTEVVANNRGGKVLARTVTAKVRFPHSHYSYVGSFLIIPARFSSVDLVWGKLWKISVGRFTINRRSGVLFFLHNEGGVVRMVTLTSELIGDGHPIHAHDHVHPAAQDGPVPGDLTSNGGPNGTNSHLCTQIRMIRDSGTSRNLVFPNIGRGANEAGRPLRALGQAGAVAGGGLTPDTLASHASFGFSLECPTSTNARRGVRFLLCLTN